MLIGRVAKTLRRRPFVRSPNSAGRGARPQTLALRAVACLPLSTAIQSPDGNRAPDDRAVKRIGRATCALFERTVNRGEPGFVPERDPAGGERPHRHSGPKRCSLYGFLGTGLAGQRLCYAPESNTKDRVERSQRAGVEVV